MLIGFKKFFEHDQCLIQRQNVYSRLRKFLALCKTQRLVKVSRYVILQKNMVYPKKKRIK